jgi:hypothetical protein
MRPQAPNCSPCDGCVYVVAHLRPMRRMCVYCCLVVAYAHELAIEHHPNNTQMEHTTRRTYDAHTKHIRRTYEAHTTHIRRTSSVDPWSHGPLPSRRENSQLKKELSSAEARLMAQVPVPESDDVVAPLAELNQRKDSGALEEPRRRVGGTHTHTHTHTYTHTYTHTHTHTCTQHTHTHTHTTQYIHTHARV